MKLTLSKLRFKNFLSSGNQFTELDLVSHQKTLFVGRNGSGKSTLLDAVSFVLFNKSFRKITKPQLVNSITNKDCVVEVEFTIAGNEWKVVRGIKPNIFEIWKNGKLESEADNRDYQKELEENILRVNHKSFCQIVMLGSAVFVPFMKLTLPDRRKVIEDLLDLEIFSRMNVGLKKKMDHLEEKERAVAAERKEILDLIEVQEEYGAEVGEARDRQIADLQQQIEDGKREIEIFKKNVEEYLRYVETIDKDVKGKEKIQKNKEKVSEVRAELRQEAQQTNKELTFFYNNTSCPTCHQDIDEEFKASAIRERVIQVDGLETLLEECDDKYKKYEDKLEIIKMAEAKKNEIKNLAATDIAQIKELNKRIDTCSKNIEQLESDTHGAFFEKMKKLKEELEEVNGVILELSDDKTVMRYAAQLLKDSGIKGKIIQQFIPVINKLINKYLAALDFFVEFNLDEQFNETILSRHRDKFSYASFSEGEKIRLDIAILFAWRAISRMRNSIHCNLLILDEILDSSLENEGIDDALKLIGNLTTEDNVIIISHKRDQVSDQFAKVIKFEKVKNFSRMVE